MIQADMRVSRLILIFSTAEKKCKCSNFLGDICIPDQDAFFRKKDQYDQLAYTSMKLFFISACNHSECD